MLGTQAIAVPSRTTGLRAAFYSPLFSKSNYLKHCKFSTETILPFFSATLKSSSLITAQSTSLLNLIAALQEPAC